MAGQGSKNQKGSRLQKSKRAAQRGSMGDENAPRQERHQIALYYLYTPRPLLSISEHVEFHKNICASLSLHGRIRVSLEGINGVLSGRAVDLQRYEQLLGEELARIFADTEDSNDSGSSDNDNCVNFDLDMKYCELRSDIPAEQQLFDTLSVKQTREVVSLYERKNESAAPGKSKRGGRLARKWRQKQARAQETLSEQVPEQASTVPASPEDIDLKAYPPAQHLSPQEWNQQLRKEMEGGDAVLLDARNGYESKVGRFSVPGVHTILPNTRKYSSLPAVFDATSEQLAGKRIYMYCTGGVRCERASAYLQALADSKRWKGDKPVEIYQLKGGIQRYLEAYGSVVTNGHDDQTNMEATHIETGSDPCLFKGRNFVFDPRRTDPLVGSGCVVGKCILCSVPHDDYDNGHAPCENKEARCCRCRVLVLVCNSCRCKVRSFGEDEAGDKPDLFCGPNGEECIDEGNRISVDII